MLVQEKITWTMGLLEWVLLITLSILWGGSFFFGEIALNELRPFNVVLGRVGFAAVVLVIRLANTVVIT